MMLRIVSPHFVAGIEPGVTAAPILAWMLRRGWDAAAIRDYCQRRGWLCQGCR